MDPPSQKPPLRGLFIRVGAVAGMIYGFANGVINPVEHAMNCSEAGGCRPEAETVGAADILLPAALGLVGGMALGLVVWMLVNWLSATR